MASLTQRLTDVDAEGLLAWISSFAGGEPTVRKVLKMRPRYEALLRQALQGMWRTPRGRMRARKFAYRDLTFAQYARVPAFLLTYEVTRQLLALPPSGGDPDQDNLLWQLIEDGYFAYLEGRVQESHLVTFFVLIDGQTNVFLANLYNWKSLAGLEPALRGRLTYIFGLRYLHLNRRDEAHKFFQVALQDAPPDTPLRKLAQAELERLKAR